MREYSLLQAPGLSFFSKDLYRDIARNWTGLGFGYLLMILSVCWLFSMGPISSELGSFFDKEAPELIAQVPDLVVKDGELSIDQPQPYYIIDPATGEHAAIIDTTGTITSLDNSPARMLATRSAVLVLENEGTIKSYPLAEADDMTITQSTLSTWLKVARVVIYPTIYLTMLLVLYLLIIIQSLAYGLIGLLFATLLKVQLSFEALVRLAVVAVTPMMVINTACMLLKLSGDWLGWLYLLGTMAYLFFGVKAVAEGEQVHG
jgi:hypothetical protein